MSKRQKLTGAAIRSREEMERLVGELCDLTIRHDAMKVAMDEELSAVRERYEVGLNAMRESLDDKLAVARDWSEENQSQFGDRKSIEMTHGTIGFRTGTPKLKTLPGWTWDRVLDFLRFHFPDFVRHKEEPDKEVIIANRDALGPDSLREMGVKIQQDESSSSSPSVNP